MIPKTKNAAFSMLELSLVILIVGLIMAGVSGGRYLLVQSRISSAEYLTKRSPVTEINGAIIWFETTSVNSLINSEASNEATISVWYNLAANNKDAIQNTVGSRPIYSTKAIGLLPAIKFDGVDDVLTFNGSDLIGSNYTIFVVEKRSSNKSNNYFIGGTSTATNSNLYLGYKTNASIAHNQYGNGYTSPTATYIEYDAKIHVFIQDVANGKKYYQNGTSFSTTADPTVNSASLVSNTGSAIGRMTTNYYQGYIGEIIMFNRALSDAERSDVELYLSTKWKIKLN